MTGKKINQVILLLECSQVLECSRLASLCVDDCWEAADD